MFLWCVRQSYFSTLLYMLCSYKVQKKEINDDFMQISAKTYSMHYFILF